MLEIKNTSLLQNNGYLLTLYLKGHEGTGLVRALLFGTCFVSSLIAGEAVISPWLYPLRPVLLQFGYDAEAALACHRYPPAMDQAVIEGALQDGVQRNLDDEDARWVSDRVIEGRANALVNFQQDRAATCAAITPGRLEALQAHIATPVPQWLERK